MGLAITVTKRSPVQAHSVAGPHPVVIEAHAVGDEEEPIVMGLCRQSRH
jgi:hypothetical protein